MNDEDECPGSEYYENSSEDDYDNDGCLNGGNHVCSDNDAANDSEIATLAQRVGEESSAALIAEFGFDAAEQRGWCERALAKYQDATIRDPIERNARDPIRKLGLHDRILGPLHLCISHGLPHAALVETMKSALAYREPSDDSAVKLAKLVDDLGYFSAITIVAEGIHESVEELLGS